jgi:hypothetical protein
MKVSFWVYSIDQGDGSCSALFFSTQEKAEAYAEAEFEADCGMGNLDSVFQAYLEIDETRKVIIPGEYFDVPFKL